MMASRMQELKRALDEVFDAGLALTAVHEHEVWAQVAPLARHLAACADDLANSARLVQAAGAAAATRVQTAEEDAVVAAIMGAAASALCDCAHSPCSPGCPGGGR